jgi:transcription elongation factor Elf1
MSSASWYVFCPRCGSPALATCEYRTSEEFLSCRFCGYSVGSRIDRGKWIEGQPYPKHQDYEHKAVGACRIQNKRGGAEWGGLNEEIDPKDWGGVVDWFQNILKDPDVDSSESYLTKWDEGNKRVVIWAGNPKLRIGDECPLECPEKCFEKYPERPERCPRESFDTIPGRSEDK